MRGLLLTQIVVSVVYVFDVSAFPFIHVPFVFLTALYLVSMAEVWGLSRLAGYLRRRLAQVGLISASAGEAGVR
ncbi:MAG: hypothetical protein ABSF83_04925 [Nitrososphaerales archaeon]|jgi:hypothetical protein